MTTIVQEFVRGSVRRDATGSDIFTALVGLVGRSKRRYGYIVHVGIVLIFLGFAGEGFKKEQQALLKPGEEVTIGYFTVRHALRVTTDGQKQMVTGHVSVFEDGKPLGTMTAGEVGSASVSRNRRPKWPSAARRPRICTSSSPAATLRPRPALTR